MPGLFISVCNLALTAGWIVLAVLLMRLVFRRAPKWLNCALWVVVALRLICPFTIESIVSLLPTATPIPADIATAASPSIQIGIAAVDKVINPMIVNVLAPMAPQSVSPMQVLLQIVCWIWLGGMMLMLAYGIYSYIRLKRRVQVSLPLTENVYLCDDIDTPFLLGLWKVKIYLPSAMDAKDYPYVIAHERAHIRRRDYLWKPLGFLLLSIYWFHPLLWLGYILLCRDIEGACDEKVIRDMSTDEKKGYMEALVGCSVHRRRVTVCPVAFGEVGVKGRIRSVMHYKKPAFWVIVAAIVLLFVLAVGFLTNPATKQIDSKLSAFMEEQVIAHHQSDKAAEHARCVDFEVLGTRKRGDQTTVYMWVLYHEYEWASKEGNMRLYTASHIPTVITVSKEGENYRLKEYWTPRDGSYYSDDVKEKFPWYLERKALDSQKYIDKQQQRCRQQAGNYFAALGYGWIYNVNLDDIKDKFPQFFEIDLTTDDLTVYIWQMSESSYRCYLTSSFMDAITDQSFAFAESISIPEMRAVLNWYGAERSQVHLRAVSNPLSSYYYVIDDVYRAKLEETFWSTISFETFGGVLYDTEVMDIDGDGTKEVCNLSVGPTSGRFSFVFKATDLESGEEKYRDVFYYNHGTPCFVLCEDGAVRVKMVTHLPEQTHFFDIEVQGGHVLLLENGKPISDMVQE